MLSQQYNFGELLQESSKAIQIVGQLMRSKEKGRTAEWLR